MMDVIYPTPGKCRKQIFVPDVYRRTGRGKTGFEMHYNRKQCSRKATSGNYCWQHSKARTL